MRPDWARWAQQINGESRVAGVIGWPVRHSLSPPMQNAALAALGLNWVYVPFAVAPERLGEALGGLRGLDLAGLNVTIPHKAAVLPYLDELSPGARLLGGANTIVHQEGRLVGYSTDGEGFLRSLEEAGEEARGKRVTLIGAGGSARAVGLALCQAGVAGLTVLNRTVEKAEGLVAALKEMAPGSQVLAGGLGEAGAQAAVSEAAIVIDSTAVGMYPHHEVAPVVPGEWLQAGQMVCDLTYNPRETVLLQAARAQGARTLDGTGMLIYQGALALELWTGQAAPVAVMRAALLERLEAVR